MTVLDSGEALSSVDANQPVMAFIFDQKGLMADLSLKGGKLTRIER